MTYLRPRPEASPIRSAVDGSPRGGSLYQLKMPEASSEGVLARTLNPAASGLVGGCSAPPSGSPPDHLYKVFVKLGVSHSADANAALAR